MREVVVLPICIAAVLAGLGLGWAFRTPPVHPPISDLALETEPAPPKPSPTLPVSDEALARIMARPNPVSADSPPEPVEQWHRSEKDQILARLEKLSNDEVEHLCFALDLIPQDEVFDKINVRGRLRRHMDQFRRPSDFADLETAIRQLEQNRARMAGVTGQL